MQLLYYFCTIDLLGFDVYLPNSNHKRIQIICHVDKFTLLHKERILEGLRIGQFVYEAEEVYSRVRLIKTVCAIMHTFHVAKLKQYTQRQTVKH